MMMMTIGTGMKELEKSLRVMSGMEEATHRQIDKPLTAVQPKCLLQQTRSYGNLRIKLI